jgi:hypothetical protein
MQRSVQAPGACARRSAVVKSILGSGSGVRKATALKVGSCGTPPAARTNPPSRAWSRVHDVLIAFKSQALYPLVERQRQIAARLCAQSARPAQSAIALNLLVSTGTYGPPPRTRAPRCRASCRGDSCRLSLRQSPGVASCGEHGSPCGSS